MNCASTSTTSNAEDMMADFYTSREGRGSITLYLRVMCWLLTSWALQIALARCHSTAISQLQLVLDCNEQWIGRWSTRRLTAKYSRLPCWLLLFPSSKRPVQKKSPLQMYVLCRRRYDVMGRTMVASCPFPHPGSGINWRHDVGDFDLNVVIERSKNTMVIE